MSAASPERRIDCRCRKPEPRPRYAHLRRLAAAKRRRKALSAVLGVTACPVLVVGLYAVGQGGDARYGTVGVVLAVALLWASDRTGGWLP